MMKEKTTNPKRVKGTVLFTVVAVMMVLIVFLTATLALAVTANNRALANYQKEQTEYTARAMLDAVMEKINEDTAGTGIKKDILDMSGSSMKINVAINHATGTDTSEIINKDVVIKKTDVTQNIYNAGAGEWQEVTLYSVEINVDSQTTAAETTYTAYIGADLKDNGNGGGSGGGGGAFVAMGQLEGDLGTGGYITGGSYINVENIEKKILGKYNIGTAGGGTTIDAPVYIYGNVNTGSKKSYVHYSGLDEFFGIEGNFTPSGAGFESTFGVESTFNWGTAADVDYEDIPVFYVGGKLDGSSSKITLGNENIPVNVFAGSFELGTSADNEAEIHGDLYAFDSSRASKLCSDGMSNLFKWAKRTITNNPNASKNYTGSVITAGDLEISLVNDDLEIGGDVRCAGNLTIKGGKKMTIKGDLICGGKVIIDSDAEVECEGDNVYADALIVNKKSLKAKNIYANTIAGSGTIDCPNVYGTAEAISWTEPEWTEAEWTEDRSWYSDYTVSTVLVDSKDESIYYSWGANNIYSAEYELQYTATLNNEVNGVLTTTTESGVLYTQKYRDEWQGPRTLETYVNQKKSEFENKYECQVARNNFLAKTTEPAQVVHEAVVHPAVEHSYSAYSGTPQAIPDGKTALEAYGKEVFPSKYAKANMPGALFTIPSADGYKKDYPTDRSTFEEGTPITKTITSADYSDGMVEVTTNAILEGTFNKGNVYINPPTGTKLKVVLKDFNMNEDGGAGKNFLLINDSSQVQLFLEGTCSIKSTGIMTVNYVKAFTGSCDPKTVRAVSPSNALTIPEVIDLTDSAQSAQWQYLPNVIIYGAVGSTLDLNGNNTICTAQVRAPETVYKQKMGLANSDITYEKANGAQMTYVADAYGNGDNNCIGVIGQLIAKDVQLDNASKWGMIYVHEPLDEPDCGCGCGTGCTKDETCTCTCTGCKCHILHGVPHDKSVNNFTVLYYNIY